MNPNEPKEAQRKSKMFWVVHEGKVHKFNGYDCSPTSKGFWWFPELGFSQHEDFCFKSESSAKKEAKKLCKRQIEFWKKRLEKL